MLDRVTGQGPLADTAAYIEAGGGYILLEQPDRAVEMLNQAISRSPEDWLAQSRLGIALALVGRYLQSWEALCKADLLKPGDPKIQVNLARVLIRINRPAKALEHLDSIPTPAPTNTTSIGQDIRVEALTALNRLQEAEEIVQSIIVAGSENIRLLKLSALIAAGRDKHQDAEFYLRQALILEPSNVLIRQKLAELATVQGHYTEAAHNLEQAVEQEPENLTIHIQLARSYLQSYRISMAEQVANKAMELATDQGPHEKAQALSAIAEVNAEQGRTEKAMDLYNQALTTQGDCLVALMGLGQLLMQVGQIKEAVESFEKAAQLAPLAAQAALISIRKFPEDPELLDEIEKAARRPSLSGSVSSSLLFSLAKAWEHRGDYGRAFEFARHANEVTRKLINYDSQQNSTKTERIIRQFSTDFIGSRRGFGSGSKVPVFVLGMPRSGTTLVEQMLSSHPAIFGAGELGHIPSWCHSLTMWEVQQKTGRQYPECVEQLSKAEAGRMAEYCLSFLRSLGQGKEFVIDKMPHNFLNIGLIHLLFPKAVIIHCCRQVRDVALSNYFSDYKAKFHGMGFAYDLEDIGRHIRDYQRLMNHWHTVLPGRILDLHYEQMVENPEGTLRMILDHMDLPWDQRVLDFQTTERQVKTASVWQVRQPIYTSSRERWRKYAPFLAPLEKILN